MIEGQPTPESKTDIKDIYFKPHLIADQIHGLKKEYYSTKVSPGVEKKEEIQEQYELLKEKRIDVREIILENLTKLGEDPKQVLENADEAMKNAQRDFERGQKDENYVLVNQTKERWHLANDFYQLLNKDESHWQNIELSDEDEGFELGELGELKNPQ